MFPNINEGFPQSSVGKESTCTSGDPSSIPGLGISAGEEEAYPLQYSGLENSMDCPWSCNESDMTEGLSIHYAVKAFLATVANVSSKNDDVKAQRGREKN